MNEDKLYIVACEVSSGKIVHYIAVKDLIGRFRIVDLNDYTLIQGTYETICEVKSYFEQKVSDGKLIIEYDEEILRFAQQEVLYDNNY